MNLDALREDVEGIVGGCGGEKTHPQAEAVRRESGVVGRAPRLDPRRCLVEGDVANGDEIPFPQRKGRPQSSSCLAMISFMTSEVPPPMVMRRVSRKNRSMGYSRM